MNSSSPQTLELDPACDQHQVISPSYMAVNHWQSSFLIATAHTWSTVVFFGPYQPLDGTEQTNTESLNSILSCTDNQWRSWNSQVTVCREHQSSGNVHYLLLSIDLIVRPTIQCDVASDTCGMTSDCNILLTLDAVTVDLCCWLYCILTVFHSKNSPIYVPNIWKIICVTFSVPFISKQAHKNFLSFSKTSRVSFSRFFWANAGLKHFTLVHHRTLTSWELSDFVESSHYCKSIANPASVDDMTWSVPMSADCRALQCR